MVSKDSVSWSQQLSVTFTEHGSIKCRGYDGAELLLITEIQSCQVQIFTSTHAQGSIPKKRFGKNKPDAEYVAATEEHPYIFIRSFHNDRLYLRTVSRSQFGYILLALLAWQNMKPLGLAKKWFAENRAISTLSADAHELLVCRFKIYGPIPTKTKNVHLVDGPRAPVYIDELEGGTTSYSAAAPEGNLAEGWFYTMGVLKSNGMLNFITELDGTLLYSIDVRKVLSSEIREMHHSICNSSNTIFIGHLRELRLNNTIRTTSNLTSESLSLPSLLERDGRHIANNLRILIEFPLHIDLEDWFVGLNYFAKREYIGMYNENSTYANPTVTRVVNLEGTLELDNALDAAHARGSESVRSMLPNEDSETRPQLASFSRDHLRVSKRVTLDIIEANFDNVSSSDTNLGKIYAEVLLWGFPWAKTSAVSHTNNAFWKDEYSTDLPILTQMIRIVIKKCTTDKGYSLGDRVIGTVYVTPDILTQKLQTVSTMMVENSAGASMKVGDPPSSNDVSGLAFPSAPSGNNIVRLSIYDAGNLPVGKLLLTVDLREYFIPPPIEFRTLENMLLNCPMKQLIEFCNCTVGTSEFENVSFILLDIFQSIGVEEQWFKALIEVELVSVDNITRKNYLTRTANTTQTNNVFNTLFRGSSIFTKSLEKYIFRIGQEYLEKVFDNFFEKVSKEKKNCEIDPRYVRAQEAAKRKNEALGESDDESISDDQSENEMAENREELDERVNKILNQNFENLSEYCEELWHRIYATSNDLPQQIKNQLKNFRTKVDLACDPDDKATALNCLSAFVFLRFFCPAILNPKLFDLTRDHQKGDVQRTLTTLAKVLLNLANRQEFTPHKEPHLMRMNQFLRKHDSEVYDYFDKLTGRKNDFNEKVLELSHEMKRFDLGLSGSLASSELPTTPYLIDKYLRLTEFIHLLQANSNHQSKLNSDPASSRDSVSTTASLVASMIRARAQSPAKEIRHKREQSHDSAEGIRLNDERNVYQIGSLEFEKSEFLDLVGDNETEGFIKSLCRSNEEIFSFITSNITMKDLQKQSATILKKVNQLASRLQRPEQCGDLQHDTKLWQAFVDNVVERANLDVDKSAIVFMDQNFVEATPHGQRRLVDNGLSVLKLRFPSEYESSLVESFSSASVLGTRGGSKNPFKRWLKRE